MEYNKYEIFNDLNTILQNNFDYVPLYKGRNVIDELDKRGWRFDKQIGFTHYYKIKAYVDDGMTRGYTWKYVFADNEEKAKERVLRHYNSQYDTFAKILEVYTYPVQDTMMFADLINT